MTEVKAHALVRELAKHLGVKADINAELTHGARIEMPNCRLWCRHDTHGGRLEVSLSVPSYRDSRGRWQSIIVSDVLTYEERKNGSIKTSITCSLDRGAEQIAKDITRRLLPTCSELMERVRKLQQHRDEHQRRRDERAALFVKRFGYEESPNGSETLYPRGSDLPRLSVSSTSIRFEDFYCSEKAALKILEILKNNPARD